ncbi:GNAT family N-acetyltransferase [Microbacterium sp. Marseille-Q6965]|uniref:GNAT family N-acetyltransferase n=1 Tax=Microbacterium sp. Marseille-Q6965 TaxID=2965072 RepID=UPI0021B72A77|nr:GNAT family N-acetyltransferase [Microbacterium sp. Marseille-Q6965]
MNEHGVAAPERPPSGERANDGWRPRLPLRTPRLLLRAHRTDDLRDLVVFHSDSHTTRYLPWPVRDVDETAAALATKVRQHEAPREGDWLVLAIEEVASGTVIGEVDLRHASATHGELGYVIRRDREGQGLASEAVAAMLQYAFDQLGLDRVDAFISPGNAASEHLAVRHGFHREPSRDSLTGPNPTLTYTVTRDTHDASA